MSFARAELVRLLLIHREITEKKYPTHARLATLCNVSERTIKRDMKLLKDEFDAPFVYDYKEHGFYYSKPFILLPHGFGDPELMALCMTLEVADSFRNTPFADALKGAIGKVQLLLPSDMALGNSPPCISRVPDPMPPEEAGAIINFNMLLSAIKDARQVRMTYYTITRDSEESRVVDPYHLYFSYGMWYLYAYCHSRQQTRDFAVRRIRKLEILPSTFTPPDPQTLHASLASRFTNEAPLNNSDATEVVIRFDSTGARWIREREWHSSQQRVDHPDGSCTLTMTVSGLAGIRRWILGFGGRHATPLSPPELVAQVREEVRAMLNNIENNSK